MSQPLNLDDVLNDIFPAAAAAADDNEDTSLEDAGPKCPRCLIPLEYDEREMDNGEVWTFFRCPKEENGVRCYVVCGTKPECKFHTYLTQVESTVCPYYLGHTPDDIPFENMECWCSQSLILCLSKSEKNPDRLYFKCRTGECKFFLWADQPPRGKPWKWLTLRIHPDHAPEQKKKPSDLRKPTDFARKRPFESRGVNDGYGDAQLKEYIQRIKTKMIKTVQESKA